MCLVQKLDTRIKQHAYAHFSCASNVHICIVRRDHLLFKRPSFAFEWCWAQGRDTDHDETNRAEKPGVGPQYAYVVHAFPFAAISEGNPCLAAFQSSKPPRHHWPDSKGQGMLCGQCQHGVRARIPRAFTCWWPPSSIWWYSFCWSERCVRCLLITESPKTPHHYRYQI